MNDIDDLRSDIDNDYCLEFPDRESAPGSPRFPMFPGEVIHSAKKHRNRTKIVRENTLDHPGHAVLNASSRVCSP